MLSSLTRREGGGILSQSMAEGTVEQDDREERLRWVSRRVAKALGFSDREAASLAFWRWLARERGETKHRVIELDPGRPVRGFGSWVGRRR
jgi:hypothetical protein